jgi:peptidoglycan hydrolase CwlO-like protein
LRFSKEGKNEALVAAQERRTNKQEDLEKKLVELKEIISRTEKDEEKLLAVSEKQQENRRAPLESIPKD